jgi:hypothetical protein
VAAEVVGEGRPHVDRDEELPVRAQLLVNAKALYGGGGVLAVAGRRNTHTHTHTHAGQYPSLSEKEERGRTQL